MTALTAYERVLKQRAKAKEKGLIRREYLATAEEHKAITEHLRGVRNAKAPN